MKKIYILSFLAAGLLASSCSKESTFDITEGEGQLLKSAISMDIVAEEFTRANSSIDADINKFNVIFYKDGNTSVPFKKYVYEEMPEVVTLPAATYTCIATYGEDRVSAWESPYFQGSSNPFDIVAYEINSYIDPIECTLGNIKVTVDFDAELRSAMSSDSYVEVRVGNGSSLNYGLDEANAVKPGYFQHTSETTLVATFKGKINDVDTTETKSYTNVDKGNHYNITFRLRNGGGGGGTGEVNHTMIVDATVSVTDVTCDVPLGDEPLLDDTERPKEEDPEGPGTDPVAQGPTIESIGIFSLDVVNNGDLFAEGDQCKVRVSTEAEGGITELQCTIDSDALGGVVAGMFGGSTTIDIANTNPDYVATLTGFDFPTNVAGESEAVFDLSTFIGMMADLGDYTHTFIFTASDCNGSNTHSLIVKFTEK